MALQEPKKLRLGVQRETTYLIEEHGTTLGLRDNSGLRPGCSGVCPTFMAEEFIFN